MKGNLPFPVRSNSCPECNFRAAASVRRSPCALPVKELRGIGEFPGSGLRKDEVLPAIGDCAGGWLCGYDGRDEPSALIQ